MKTIKTLLLALFLLALPGVSQAIECPPLPTNYSYFVVPPGECSSGVVELGTYKPLLFTVWTRTPKQTVATCEKFPEETFVGRYRLAVRCIDPTGEHPPSDWVRSNSGLNYPWPAECPPL